VTRCKRSVDKVTNQSAEKKSRQSADQSDLRLDFNCSGGSTAEKIIM
jgi:hypothetical protein